MRVHISLHRNRSARNQRWRSETSSLIRRRFPLRARSFAALLQRLMLILGRTATPP